MNRIPDGCMAVIAATSMLIALGLQNITLTTQDYRSILLSALGCMTIADILCTVMVFRGRWPRWVGLLIAAPSIFIVLDFLRRAPSTFGWGMP